MGPPPAVKLARIWPVDSEVVSWKQADGWTHAVQLRWPHFSAMQAMKKKEKND